MMNMALRKLYELHGYMGRSNELNRLDRLYAQDRVSNPSHKFATRWFDVKAAEDSRTPGR